MINAEQLNAIKERAAKATPGPWEIDRNSDDDVFVTDIWFNGEDGGHAEIHGDTVASSIQNAEFLASCREDVPALVAEVEFLHSLLRQRDRQLEGERKGSQRTQTNVERLHQENESLKRSLQYIADRRESNRDWTVAHNALAVYGRPKGAY